jgi:hypothetical protein
MLYQLSYVRAEPIKHNFSPLARQSFRQVQLLTPPGPSSFRLASMNAVPTSYDS